MRHALTKRSVFGALVLALFAAPTLLVGAQAPLDVCLPLCDIPSTANGYATPATVVLSGSTLQWSSADGQYHSATSADYALDARIFDLDEEGGPGAATFEIRDDGLYVKNKGMDEWTLASSALDVGGGAFVLQYQCLFHYRFQKGAIVVAPSGP